MYNNKPVLLIGNGLNRTYTNENNQKSIKWDSLLQRLAKKLDINVYNDGHLTLKLDKIYLDWTSAGTKRSRRNLKAEIIKVLLNTFEDLENDPSMKYKEDTIGLIQTFFDIECDNILTTNYDYMLEEALKKKFDKKIEAVMTSETTYSIRRRYSVDRKSVWHIHGEANKVNSLRIGYSDYCSYVARMSSHLSSKPDSSPNSDILLHHILRGGEVEDMIWPYFIFKNDVYIVGLNLDFLEIDLWWLLDYRAHFVNHSEKDLRVTNSIYFYCKESLDDEKKSLFKSMHIDVVNLKIATWPEYYKTVAEDISARIKNNQNIGC